MKSMGIEKMKFFPEKDMEKVSGLFLTRFKNYVQGGEDAHGRKFPKYSKGYAKYKANNMRTFTTKDWSNGPRSRLGLRPKGTRLEKYSGASITSNNVATPDFTLRGITLKTNRIKDYDSDGFTFGWDGEGADIVTGNAAKGRDIISDLPDKEWQWILGQLGVSIDKQWRKVKNVRIRVGSSTH